jgi:hypothetical protein
MAQNSFLLTTGCRHLRNSCLCALVFAAKSLRVGLPVRMENSSIVLTWPIGSILKSIIIIFKVCLTAFIADTFATKYAPPSLWKMDSCLHLPALRTNYFTLFRCIRRRMALDRRLPHGTFTKSSEMYFHLQVTVNIILGAFNSNISGSIHSLWISLHYRDVNRRCGGIL